MKLLYWPPKKSVSRNHEPVWQLFNISGPCNVMAAKSLCILKLTEGLSLSFFFFNSVWFYRMNFERTKAKHVVLLNKFYRIQLKKAWKLDKFCLRKWVMRPDGQYARDRMQPKIKETSLINYFFKLVVLGHMFIFKKWKQSMLKASLTSRGH